MYLLSFPEVSIPYRLATNLSQLLSEATFITVSIPYRLATNEMKEMLEQREQTSFNSLQVSYKHEISVWVAYNRYGFQFLIGQLQTPDRLAGRGRRIRVSIPYRLATNEGASPFKSIFCTVFQFLIGQLQTSEGQELLNFPVWFQFLIGQLQTSEEVIPPSGIIAVSIPYRLATISHLI